MLLKRISIFIILISVLILISFSMESILSKQFDIYAKIESKRKDNLLILIFSEKPAERRYFIIEKKNIIGKIDILSILYNKNRKAKYRVLANYSVVRDEYEILIRAGSEIALIHKSRKHKRDFSELPNIEVIKYRKNIVSEIDEREMVLIEKGKFVLGSNRGDKDEYPEQIIFLKDFYIDKYEVSNKDYKKFIDAANSKPPASWVDEKYDEKYAQYPVLVTFYEAQSYAKWCRKRLPTEAEWEKAARGPYKAGRRANIYPWGNKFKPDLVNSIEFWSEDNKSINSDIKKLYGIVNPGLLPVYTFKKGASPFGVINISGNAIEWTSSWYMPYKKNSFKDPRFGQQYKVLRGGAWFSNKYKVRVANREIGGIPNLYRDNVAGFRCVRDVKYLDRVDINE